MAFATFNTLVLGMARPPWAGAVKISDNDPASTVLNLKNPRKVEGIVVPVFTTGRPGAPKPISGAPTGAALSLDKGHLMALELGGPDVSSNIIPQENLWQQSGGWRQLEVAVAAQAMEWMGWTQKANPSANIPMPANNIAAFFHVAPETLDATATPETYIGAVTRVAVWASSNPSGPASYAWEAAKPHTTRMFYIRPQGFTWR